MKLLPLYRINDLVLVGLKIDYVDKKVNDGLVLDLDLNTKRINNLPWSLQTKLKFGFYYPIKENEIELYSGKVQEIFSQNQVNEMEAQLSKINFVQLIFFDSVYWRSIILIFQNQSPLYPVNSLI